MKTRVHWSLLTLFVLCFALCTGARADDGTSAPSPVGHTQSGLTGVGSVLSPRAPEGFVAAGALGYGITESFGPTSGVHQRLSGALGAAYTPRDWFSVALHFQGRLDFHPADDRGKDRTGTGDPYLTFRTGRAFGRYGELGGSLAIWVPGVNAPSLVFRATTVELRVLHEKQFAAKKLTLLANLGFRIDQSANSAPDLERLRYGDRSALGLSDFHAIPWGIALVHALREDVSLFGDLSGQFLLSGDKDVMLASPARLGVGARHFAPRGLEYELALRLSLAAKPSFLPGAPLVPLEPRVSLQFGLRWDAARARGRAQPVAVPADEERDAPVVVPVLTAPPHVRGVVQDERGQPLPDCAVWLELAGQHLEALTSGDGSFEFDELAHTGEATLTITARGYAPRMQSIQVERLGVDLPPEKMERSTVESGVLRMSTRSFQSDAVSAEVVVKNARGREVSHGRSDEHGLYEATLPPGSYKVTTSLKGFRTNTVSVRVSTDEVSIVNIDLREAK